MTDPLPAGGADLARQALKAARAAAKRHGATTKQPTRRPARTRGADGRDPVTFAAALMRLADERGWNTGIRGGSILDTWPDLFPEYEGRVQAVAFDPSSGQLDLLPASPAYATQLRLMGSQLCRQINAKLNSQTVETIRVLAPNSRPTGKSHTPQPDTAPRQAPEPPARTEPADRSTQGPSAGFLRAREAHRSVYRPYDDPAGAQAVERQLAALRAHRLPDEEHSEYRYLREQEAEQRRREKRSTDASLRAALRYKRTGQTASATTDQRPATGVA